MRTKVKDVLSIIFPSEEFAEDALLILRGCISEVTGYPEESIDMTAFGNQVDLMSCEMVEDARRTMSEIELNTLRYLQEQ